MIASCTCFGKHALADAQPEARHPVDAPGRVAERVESLVERAVLAAVHRLLPDEAGDLRLELGVGDAVAVVADRPDEEVLAFWEQRRQDGDDMAHHQVAAGVVARQFLARVGELDAPRLHPARGDRPAGPRQGGTHVVSWLMPASLGTTTAPRVLMTSRSAR